MATSKAPKATPKKTSARPKTAGTGRALNFGDQEEKKTAKSTAPATQETSGSSSRIKKHGKNAATAFKWFQNDKERFAKYRNYIKNNDKELTSEIQGHFKANKADLIDWVTSTIGSASGMESATKQDIVDIAIVAAGLTIHGLAKLQQDFDAGNMDDLQNATYHAYNLRSNSSQQEARKQSRAKDMHKKHAAHYVGLEVGMTLNNSLPPTQRVGVDELRQVLNILKNLQIANAKTNLTLHKQVDSRLLDADDHGTLTRDEYKRLKQIVKKAQSNEFREAVRGVDNGNRLYLALRDRISSFDTGDQARLWDPRKDPPALQRPASES